MISINLEESIEESLEILNGTKNFNSKVHSCPTCRIKYTFKSKKGIVNKDEGILRTTLMLPCNHSFIISLNHDGSISNWVQLRNVEIIAIKLNVEYLEENKKKLEELHQVIIESKRHDKAFEILKEINRINKQIEELVKNEEN